jgi:putative SOS response-associated peptidase YedK
VAERRKAKNPDVGLPEEPRAVRLAGLWDVWRKPDGGAVESFTIITTEPNELVRPNHNVLEFLKCNHGRTLSEVMDAEIDISDVIQ